MSPTLHFLVMADTDLVLGIKWLQRVGPITSDFSVPSTTFHYDNQPITLIGKSSTPPNYCRMSHT
ncbi:hypothetical protein Lal_00033752 [Lupinus albus]|nr:hypothetical protein Lal_00033752 [Lupinus albus]